MSEATIPAQGPVDVLVGRLRVAATKLGRSDEWEDLRDDLHHAAAEIERLRAAETEMLGALDALVSACELPGDHCEVEQALPAAITVIAKALGVPPNAELGVTAPEEADVNRIAIAEAGVRRCFARRHEGRYAFMPYEDAVRHCRKWIAALRDMRMEK